MSVPAPDTPHTVNIITTIYTLSIMVKNRLAGAGSIPRVRPLDPAEMEARIEIV